MTHLAVALALVLASNVASADAPNAVASNADATPAAQAAPAVHAAPSNATATAADAPKRRKVCTRERPMGSNMPKRVCRDADAADEEGERAREALRDVQRNRFDPPAQGL